ncbi:GDSL esterase/lipase At4g16230-like [Neltuma alba]|uniref:GDSL esterase/lipase At4g16230-like n=1 Tax=Neltuma alba TaxID=207710 RepID=UPI0010A58C69|nr:GDSL esterase/lipase At4g16230-like [Prosopis alba]XP_028788435.1 GDSL esterase/lipase At4g16230-like [Prosopis alba]
MLLHFLCLETGNNNYIVSLAKANFVPSGIDFGEPSGRFTNGRTVADITGFENSDSTCCRLVGRFGGLAPCLPKSEVYEDRPKFVLWDAYHPSEAANMIIAKRLFDGDANDNSPINIRKLSEV